MSYDYPVTFTKTNQFGDGPIEEDDVYTVEEFKEGVITWCFTDDDGFGYPVKDKKADKTILIHPSEINSVPSDATHIVWYNR